MVFSLAACGGKGEKDSNIDAVIDDPKENAVGSFSVDAPPEEVIPVESLSQAQEWWDGDWYGYWETHSETDDYTDFQGGRWECFGFIDMETDDTGDIYLWDPEGDFAMANVSVNEDGGGGQMGAAISESGHLWFGGEISHGDWIIDPDIYEYENYMVIDGRYTDNLGGGFNYIVYLRPWGESWDENLEEERPLWYDTWYLSAYKAASMWEAIEDRDAHIHSEIGDISLADAPKASESGASTSSVNADISNVKGKIIDPGNITLLCPDGWTSFSIPDYLSSQANAKNPNGIDLRKGSEGEGYEYLMPSLEIQYYEHGFSSDEPTNKYEGKSENWGPIELGGHVWKGFIGLDEDKAFIWTNIGGGYSQITIRLELEAEGVRIGLGDAEVQAIINSIKVK